MALAQKSGIPTGMPLFSFSGFVGLAIAQRFPHACRQGGQALRIWWVAGVGLLLAAAAGAHRPLPAHPLHLRREGRGWVRGGHDRLRALCSRAADLLALVQVPPASRPPLLLRPLPELPDDRGWRAERTRLRRADPGWRRRRAAERVGVARSRRARHHGQDRRPVHAGRLLLPDDDPSAAPVAGLREGAPEPRRPRQAAQGRGGPCAPWPKTSRRQP